MINTLHNQKKNLYLRIINPQNKRITKSNVMKIEKLALAQSLVRQIFREYKSLEFGIIYDTYHDSLLIQYNEAKQAFYDFEILTENVENITLEYMDGIINDLVDTLEYATAIATLSMLSNRIPEPIYG